MNNSQIGKLILFRCDTFFQTTQLQLYQVVGEGGKISFIKGHQQVLDFYRNQHPLHRDCLNTHVNAQQIFGCIHEHGSAVAAMMDHDGMTPLHILAMNPHADEGSLMACLDANMSAAILGDGRGFTPLDYLRVYHDIEDHTAVLSALILHRE